MRGSIRLLLVLLFLTVETGVCLAHTPVSLRVRRVPSAEDAEGASREQIAKAQQAQKLRIERWRSFHDVLIGPGMDWSVEPARTRSRPLSAKRGSRAAKSTLADPLGPPDTIRVAILRIDFAADRGGSASTGDGRFDLSGPDPNVPPIDRPPRNRTFYLQHLEALRRFYDAQTYGRVVIEGDVWPRQENQAYTMTDMADFGPWVFGQSIYGAAVHMFRTFVLEADTESVQLNDRIPWDRIDRVILLHAGSDLQSDLRQDSPEDIPSFTIGVSDSDAVVLHDVATPGDSVIVDRAALIPETINQDGYFGAINGVLAHEDGHLLFGLADLYDVSSGFPVVGEWSLMDSGNNVGTNVLTSSGEELFATGLLPPSIDPFQRQFCTDVLTFPEMVAGDTVAIRNSERYPDIRKVTLSTDEYLLVENRYQAPVRFVELDQDSATHVVLGPKIPDRYEYDALLRGGGILIWQIDESVIPFETSLRVNPDFGFNSDPVRHGVDLLEADGLNDLGDPGSPYIVGSYRDPWYVDNKTTLADSTRPPLITNSGTHPHARLDVLDVRDSIMQVGYVRTWKMSGWPVAAGMPPGGPQLLAVDADGDRAFEVCWAGGDTASADSAALFAVRVNGFGLASDSVHAFAHLDRRPRPVMAAIPTGGTLDVDQGPSLFAASTFADRPDTSGAGGRVWLVNHLGQVQPGWPPKLPSIVTTPPVIAGQYPTANVFVGCADGIVYVLGLNGVVRGVSNLALLGGVAGRLAVADRGTAWQVAAGGANGDVAVFSIPQGIASVPLAQQPGWPRHLMPGGFEPDFLWVDLDGGRAGASGPSGCTAGGPELVVHHADYLWAFCGTGDAIPGWARSYGDTLVAGLGAGDPDGDGFDEVLTQSYGAQIAFLNATGHPSPGWPRKGTPEARLVEDPELTFPREPREYPTLSAPIAVDLHTDHRPRVVTLNTSGLLVALDGAGQGLAGWPLATGSGAAGAPLAVDLDRDGKLELIAPDRDRRLYGYSLPGSSAAPQNNPWPMLGGDAGRTSSLPSDRMTSAPAPVPGPLVAGSLIAYPNPARRKPVTFAWRMTEPGDAEFRILDSSGHEVASFSRRGSQSDNLVVWDPGALPAGLYLARVRFRGGSGERVEVVPVGLLR